MRIHGLVALVASLLGCASQSAGTAGTWVVLPATTDTTGVRVTIVGTVQYSDIEGGVYSIRADDGTNYDPTNLPTEFRKDGLAVEAEAHKQENMAGINQLGPIVQLIRIRVR